jgi:hypothetical protein
MSNASSTFFKRIGLISTVHNLSSPYGLPFSSTRFQCHNADQKDPK